MTLTSKDWIQLTLVTLIIAALPIVLYPNTAGFDFETGLFWYLLLELTYFGIIYALRNHDRTVGRVVSFAFSILFGRLTLSAVFMVLLIMMKPVRIGEAAEGAFGTYKLALLLFSLTAPFLYHSTFHLLFPAERLTTRGRLVRQPVSYPSSSRTMTTGKPVIYGASVPTPAKSADQYFDHTFNEALRHVGEYSGVVAVLLVDDEGLVITCWDPSGEFGEVWAPLSVKMISDLNEVISKAGAPAAEALEFRSGSHRVQLLRVQPMWLVSIAEASSEELEKIRLQQAAEMISRHYGERYKVNVDKTEMGRTYARSVV